MKYKIKHSKRFLLLKNKILEKSYTIDNAILLLKEISNAKFIESFEVHISLNIDPKYAEQQLRTTLVLPNGTGNSLTIATLVQPELIYETLQLGADIAGYDDLIENITNGKLGFDILITTPQLMPKLAKLGKILGPKGLMPSPKSGTVTQKLAETIAEFKKGKIEYRADKTGIVHLIFGKINFSNLKLKENLLAIYSSIEKNKPKGVKGKYFKSINICTSMGPGVNIELNSFKNH